MVANMYTLMTQAGPDTYRLAHLEAGAVAQRLALAARGFGFASCATATFYDDELRKFVGLELTGWEPLLIVAVGSNYALFFNPERTTEPDAQTMEGISPRTLASLVFANLTTVAGFGLLGISQVPVLQAIGVTVGPGAVLALLLSAIFARDASGEAA